VYPLLEDDTCWFLACDLDGATWQLDALALFEACEECGVPAALERSRSGTGGHVWVFFTAPVAASAARRLGALLLRQAMTRRGEPDEVALGVAALSPRRMAQRDGRLPTEIRCVIGADLAIARADLSPSLLAELKHLASLHNPLFYERQRLRLSTHQTPRLIRCYDEDLTHLHLPRGLLHPVEDAVSTAGGRLVTDDRRPTHTLLPLAFRGGIGRASCRERV